MTIHVVLPTSSQAGPSSPLHLENPVASQALSQVVNQLGRAKRIVVVSGAGVSTAASIPDFRSGSGIFSKPRRGHDVRDLFHVKALSSPSLLHAHRQLLNELSSLSLSASPTPFHIYLKNLDNQGRLLRCYTQNIDGLELRAGLSVGLPPHLPQPSSRKRKRPSSPPDPNIDPALFTPIPLLRTPIETPTQAAPRCIPLHGQLDHLNCPLCSSSFPLISFLPLPSEAMSCPTCSIASTIRTALAERQRRIGHLRPSVVLYGEEHPEGEAIGAVVERDLRGTGSVKNGQREGKVDFLLVTGTSLTIPGVKRIVKEMARSLRQGNKRGKGKGKDIKTVFVNAEPAKGDWEGVFDIWIQGDIQEFITTYLDSSLSTSMSSEGVVTPSLDVVNPITPTKPKSGQNGQYEEKETYLPTPPKTGSSQGKKSTRTSSDLPTPTPKRRKPHDQPFDTPTKTYDLTSSRNENGERWLPTPRSTPVKRIVDSRKEENEVDDDPFACLALGA
ncbi:hypothetical protein TREMEDRAFT_40493 [Tremella mesenterica DSM 1558]|uniref:uncharacterized protein n=1 Tax=Tremella mesenterica (strain ATCC 24925 / CBS 8224 / DSM 1558 / NBRC 9311 / NRRL Y-6157 / RJB 2259-6 / UBC 559-6) TaxID=578456 RepID=UPI0003F49C0D|nr:uncharacterized protein TREMEDRAFT_40493 [Tremella mesenterica DSM 1558]EIW67352.1 hypothetical protein TREMEDRAFT_40493 [Tremella mesenterica DSM 1558]